MGAKVVKFNTNEMMMFSSLMTDKVKKLDCTFLLWHFT